MATGRDDFVIAIRSAFLKKKDKNVEEIDIILKRYPEKNKKSAVMPLLYLAQKQNNN